MPKTIAFTNLYLKRVIIDAVALAVFAEYRLTDVTGQYERSGTAAFWKTMPPHQVDTNRNTVVNEDWFQLTAADFNQVAAIYQKVQNALQTLFLA